MLFDENTVKEFFRDFKKLRRKYRSLDEDFSRFKKALEIDKENLTGVERVSLKKKVKIPVYIAKKFRCKALVSGSKSGIRIVFAYEKSPDKIIFIEIYYKGQKEIEDKERILRYFEE